MVGTEQQKTMNAKSPGDLNWLLDDLVARVAQIDKAVILSRDGLAIGASQGLSREDAEHLSAVAAAGHVHGRLPGLHQRVPRGDADWRGAGAGVHDAARRWPGRPAT